MISKVYFSHYLSKAPKAKKLGPDGKTLTQPRGIYPGSPKTGKIESSFFSKVAYTSIGKIEPLMEEI